MTERDFKKEIYDLWGDQNPATFPLPTPEFIASRAVFHDFYITHFLPSDRSVRILDLGCGYGLFLKACQEAGYTHLVGVEYLKPCVTFAREKLSTETIYNSDIIEFLQGATPESYEVITAFDVMEHFQKSQIIGLFSLVRTLLKPGGRFIMQVPNGGSLSGLYTFYSDLTHDVPYTDSLLEELSSVTGFSRLEISTSEKVLEGKGIKKQLKHLAQTMLKKVMGFDNQFMFSRDLVGVFYK